jgi:hypothetical protein
MASVRFQQWYETFASTGDICPIRLGMFRDELRAAFGEPDDVGATSRKRPRGAIWVYGGLEFHFDPGAGDELFLIYRDTPEGVVETSLSRLQLDAELLYLHLGDFAHHVVDLLGRDARGELAAIARALEHLHVEGDDDVKEAATIGLLEGIQNVAGHRNVSTEALEAALGDEARRWWRSLDAFWSGKIPYVGADIGKGVR